MTASRLLRPVPPWCPALALQVPGEDPWKREIVTQASSGVRSFPIRPEVVLGALVREWMKYASCYCNILTIIMFLIVDSLIAVFKMVTVRNAGS